jgi:hypothetical protein
MIQPLSPDRGPSLLMIEGGFTVILCAVAYCWPRLASKYFSRIERVFKQLAQRKGLSVVTVGVTALLLRLAILPLSPIPKPFILDAFSYVLAGDTFASGRLTNPTPAMWTHFETFQITMRPTYMSMYFPAQGMVLAAGKVLAGQQWFGLLFVTALMCAAICWMLQAWLPPTWALLGGMLAVLRLGLFSYWINTYSGGGSIAALGGALVLGAFPRFMKRASARDALLLAVGMIVLAISRPYEGILLCIPVVVVLGRWLLFGQNRPASAVLLRRTAAPLALMILAGLWMAYYNYRVFGDPLTQPYKINRLTYATAPHFIWQTPRPEPVYRHPVMRSFYSGWELDYFLREKTVRGFLTETPIKLIRAVRFFAGLLLLPPLIMMRSVIRDHRTRLLVWSVVILAAGMLMETWLIPHYLSPFTAVFYALGLQAMRHLRVWSPGERPVGLGLVRMTVVLCIVLAGLRAWAVPLHLGLPFWPSEGWYGSIELGVPRAQVEARLEQQPGGQLVIVRYSPSHDSLDEWVYNAADIDRSKVVWAREMDAANNVALMQYYKDRKVWLVQPDSSPAQVSPYTVDAESGAALR